MTLPECVVYLPRDYPSLSQTFVRTEVMGLRDSGLDVEVLALRWSLTDNIPEGWGGPHRLAHRESWPRSVRDSLFWAVTRPVRYLKLWRHVLRSPAGRRWTAVRLLPTYARQLQHRRVLAVHTHFAFEHLWSTLYLATLLKVPATITVHAADIYLDTATAITALNHFDTVVNVCSYNEEFLVAHGLSGPKLAVVACGVDVPEEYDAPAPGSGAHIVSVGRLVPKKGFEGLLRALPSVLAQVPAATVEIIGGGVLEEDLQLLADELGLRDVVTFRGPLPNDEVLAAIAAADVFALNCVVPEDGNTDALPVVIREAMARARPVVTTAVAGIPETVDDTCGWVVAPDDRAQLADALVEALTRKDLASRKASRARTVTLERFTNALSAQAMRAVFEDRPDGSAARG